MIWLSLGCMLCGLVLIVGAARDWPSITDPPWWTAFFYSQGLLRRIFSRDVMRVLSAALGALMLGAGIWTLL